MTTLSQLFTTLKALPKVIKVLLLLLLTLMVYDFFSRIFIWQTSARSNEAVKTEAERTALLLNGVTPELAMLLAPKPSTPSEPLTEPETTEASTANTEPSPLPGAVKLNQLQLRLLATLNTQQKKPQANAMSLALVEYQYAGDKVQQATLQQGEVLHGYKVVSIAHNKMIFTEDSPLSNADIAAAEPATKASPQQHIINVFHVPPIAANPAAEVL